MDIIIYGCGKCGQYAFNDIMSKDKGIYNIIGWIDNYVGESVVLGLSVKTEEEFLDSLDLYDLKHLIVLMAINNYEVALEKGIGLHLKGIEVAFLGEKIYSLQLPIINESGFFNSCVVKYRIQKPALPYLEFQIADHCNLNCKACMHFSNIVNKSQYISYHDFNESLSALENKFSDIKMIRIMGGEPLLNRNISDYCSLTRKKFRDSEIRIVTNGLLITSISEELITVMKQNRIVFDISLYPPTKTYINKIMRFCEVHGLDYIISDPVNQFILRLSKGDENPDKVFEENCLSKRCTFLRNKKLFICPHIPMLFEQRDYFGLQIERDEFEKNAIDIFDDDISGWDILERFRKSFSMCRFCSSNPKNVDWSCGVAQKEDWFC